MYRTIVCGLLLVGPGIGWGGPPPADHRILEQPDAPISIIEYVAEYQNRGQYSSEGIRHTVTYRNRTGRKIVAMQFGLLAFNIFNEFQDRLGGYTIEDVDPDEVEIGVWIANARAESSFYTGVAYISKVRFEDGEVWNADYEGVVLQQLQEIEQDLELEALGI